MISRRRRLIGDVRRIERPTLMLRTCICLCTFLHMLATVFTATAHADEPATRFLPLPQQLQGDWDVKNISLDGKPLRDDAWFPPGVRVSTWMSRGVRVSGVHAWSRGKSQQEAEEGRRIFLVGVSTDNSRHIGIIRAGPNGTAPPVLVGYLAGIYKQEGDAIFLCLSYVGQGLEGEAARQWAWPSEFDIEEGEGHYHVRLERTRSKAKKDAPEEVSLD